MGERKYTNLARLPLHLLAIPALNADYEKVSVWYSESKQISARHCHQKHYSLFQVACPMNVKREIEMIYQIFRIVMMLEHAYALVRSVSSSVYGAHAVFGSFQSLPVDGGRQLNREAVIQPV